MPVYFHALTAKTTRPVYESMSLELFPLYACPVHTLPESVVLTPAASQFNSPRKLVKFHRDGSYHAIHMTDPVSAPPCKAQVSGAVFSNSSAAVSTVQASSVCQFVNRN